jgi:hypothetical protein
MLLMQLLLMQQQLLLMSQSARGAGAARAYHTRALATDSARRPDGALGGRVQLCSEAQYVDPHNNVGIPEVGGRSEKSVTCDMRAPELRIGIRVRWKGRQRDCYPSVCVPMMTCVHHFIIIMEE